jgi:hypothetical protein
MDDTQNSDSTTQNNTAEQPIVQNFGFATPSELGLTEMDPNKIPAAPRPQPGMTFTPSGGSVSDINHQLNNEATQPEQPNTQA